MTGDDREDGTPRRFQTLRFNPVRAVLPWLCAGFGVILMIRNVTPVLFFVGLGLVVFGIAAFFLYRWMSRKGI